jgi:predicted nucleotidyltransferase/predicted DNA-binding transcriptional regulator
MLTEKTLDSILNTKTKLKVIRLFLSRTPDFRATGRGIARMAKVSPPSAHSALKELYNKGILKLEIIGGQHIYSIHEKNRIVADILKPLFAKELSSKDDIKSFLQREIETTGLKNKLISLLLYGSVQRGDALEKSDVDIAAIVKDDKNKEEVETVFLEVIGKKFSEYFGAHLDVYVKSKDEFVSRMKKRLPPVSTLMKSYAVLFGKDPLEFV